MSVNKKSNYNFSYTVHSQSSKKLANTVNLQPSSKLSSKSRCWAVMKNKEALIFQAVSCFTAWPYISPWSQEKIWEVLTA